MLGGTISYGRWYLVIRRVEPNVFSYAILVSTVGGKSAKVSDGSCYLGEGQG